jgi:O-methyltransferase
MESRSLITPDRLDNLRRAVARTAAIGGEMAELGVYRGGSALVLAEEMPQRTLHLFDTFRGMPCSEQEEYDPAGHVRQGMFDCSEQEVREFLSGRRVVFHAGLFPDTAQGLESVRFSFVHIDCDLYQSAKDGIAWFWPRMGAGAILFFDDYGCDFTGVTHAVREVFSPYSIEMQYDVNGFQIGCLVVHP